MLAFTEQCHQKHYGWRTNPIASSNFSPTRRRAARALHGTAIRQRQIQRGLQPCSTAVRQPAELPLVRIPLAAHFLPCAVITSRRSLQTALTQTGLAQHVSPVLTRRAYRREAKLKLRASQIGSANRPLYVAEIERTNFTPSTSAEPPFFPAKIGTEQRLYV